MEGNNVHYRHILLYYFKKGKRAADAHKKICYVYDDDALTERVCQKWFAKFRSGDFYINDAPRSGRPTKINSDNVKAIIDKDPCQSVREIATALKHIPYKRRKSFTTAGIRFSAQCLGAARINRGQLSYSHIHL